MRKNSGQVSKSKIKRAKKNLIRKQNKKMKIEKQVDWLEAIVTSGVEIDIDKMMYENGDKTVMNMRDPKSVNLILAKLTSRIAAKVKK